MLFWIAAAALAAATGVVVLRPLLSNGPEEQAERPDIALYKAQLQEIENDLERGTLTTDEAEASITEVSRRLLAADKAAADVLTGAPTGATRFAIAGGWLLLVIGAAGAYMLLGAPLYPDAPRAARLAAANNAIATRMPQAEAEAQRPQLPPTPQDAEYMELVENLRRVAAERPDDIRGQEFLVRAEANLGNFGAAARAQERVVALKESADHDDLALLLDLYVYAAGGYVSREAAELTDTVLEISPDSVAGRFYKGLLYDQVDRPDLAFSLWKGVLDDAPGSAHAGMARNLIADTASRAGETYTTSGPSAEDIAAAQDMAPEDRGAMIEGMVERLAARLATDGGTPEEWARLIRTLGVLGQTDRAAAIWGEAQARFAPEALGPIRAAAQEAGVE